MPGSQGACMACRARKVKCIPGTRRCARCTTLGIQDCHYAPVKKRGAGSTLRMNEACVPCRQKKDKCDAKQPCTTCLKRDRVAACTYERSRSSANVSSRLPRSPTKSSKFVYFHHVPPDPHERPSTPPERPESPHALDEAALVLSSSASAVEKARGVTECPPPLITSSLTILPSIHFQSIPRPLPLPLSVIPPERKQVSWVSENDLDMSYRLRGLCRMNKLGLYLTQEKQEAILRGDTSNSVVNYYFLDAIQAMGMVLSGIPDKTPAIVRLHARYAQRAWESLIQLKQTNQERVKVQALVVAVHCFVLTGLNVTGQLYLLKGCKIIDKANLRFLPAYEPPAEFSDQVREEVSALSQTIYLENYLYLALGGPAPLKTARIEREFRSDLRCSVDQRRGPRSELR
ncbi:hypothetical protein BJ322DRAFT_369328 [Thelephora terrestris]|uniref:Zn(2)-C6 fungal-type domain-containing protein n=1 Tax=Thelephora terrestris TaxID=56493 RepID=A0A9P6L2E5_9AGAM|nr:hypothetical protein BJ322DRAFT_369328 [Thelephora terrestris]